MTDTNETAYLVEWLRPFGWRQSNVLHFRYRDAMQVAERELADKLVRKVRIRRVVIDTESVFSAEQTYLQQETTS